MPKKPKKTQSIEAEKQFLRDAFNSVISDALSLSPSSVASKEARKLVGEVVPPAIRALPAADRKRVVAYARAMIRALDAALVKGSRP